MTRDCVMCDNDVMTRVYFTEKDRRHNQLFQRGQLPCTERYSQVVYCAGL